MPETIIDRMRERAGDLWSQATTHPSAGNDHYQRLEFLGNGVLNLALADLLYHLFPEREGKLSKICNFLRSDDVLSDVGRDIGLTAFIKYTPNGEGGPVDSVVAGSLEAVVGAIYERAGYSEAIELIAELFLTERLLERAQKDHDPITELKEVVEARGWQGHIRHASFPREVDGNRLFYHVIELDGRTTVGMGLSKKRAEAQASRCMLSILAKDASSD